MAAIDDVRIVEGQNHPLRNGRVVILENSNRGASVKVNVKVTGNGNRTLFRVGLGDTTTLPRQFEIIVGPGRSRWIGGSRLLQPQTPASTYIDLTYEIVGAAYSSDEPILPARRYVAELLGFYEFVIPGKISADDTAAIVCMNLGNEWAITATLDTNDGTGMGINLPPFTCSLVGSRLKSKAPVYKLLSPAFYEVFPPTLVSVDP